MSEVSKKVGEYLLLRKIGKGATAEVFQARKEGSNESYAVKMIRLKGKTPQQRQVIKKQINIIKSIHHKNIV